MSTTTMTSTKTTFEDLLAAAKRKDWAFVDEHIGGFIKMNEVLWALNHGLIDSEYNIRDLAATILDESEVRLPGPTISQQLEAQMQTDPYPIVCFRLAVALWKRGYHTDAVMAKMREALADPDVGETARKWEKIHLASD